MTNFIQLHFYYDVLSFKFCQFQPQQNCYKYNKLQKKNILSFHNLVIATRGLTNPLARRPGVVISTFGLAKIISCMPDGIVKIYIGY